MKLKHSRPVPLNVRLVRTAIFGLSVAGLGVSGYLTYVHYAVIEPLCVFNAKCDVVLASSFAQIWGVPLALLGLVMYATVLAFSLMARRRDSAWQHLVALGLYGVTLTGMVFTVYLYYLEIFVIHAFCSWCVISSVILAGIFILAVINFTATGRNLRQTGPPRHFRITGITAGR